MVNSWIIWGWLNSWKWMIPRILKNMSLWWNNIDPNWVISLSDINSIDWVFDSVNYTDDMRFQYYQTLTDDEKREFFPKFHLAKMYRKTVSEIMSILWWEYWWNNAELYESNLLFNNLISSYLRSLNTLNSSLTIWVWLPPEGIKKFLDESSNPDVFNTIFVVKTNVNDILERLNQDKTDLNHSKSWPLRLADDELYKAAKLISLNWLSIAEDAEKQWFRVIDTSKNSDETLLKISREIFNKQKNI